MKRLTAAELVLRDLGVTDPKQIDLEAIAWTLGAQVKFDRSMGVGPVSRAVPSVRSSPSTVAARAAGADIQLGMNWVIGSTIADEFLSAVQMTLGGAGKTHCPRNARLTRTPPIF